MMYCTFIYVQVYSKFTVRSLLSLHKTDDVFEFSAMVIMWVAYLGVQIVMLCARRGYSTLYNGMMIGSTVERMENEVAVA